MDKSETIIMKFKIYWKKETKNNNGEQIIKMCLQNDSIITNSFWQRYQQDKINKIKYKVTNSKKKISRNNG